MLYLKAKRALTLGLVDHRQACRHECKRQSEGGSTHLHLCTSGTHPRHRPLTGQLLIRWPVHGTTTARSPLHARSWTQQRIAFSGYHSGGISRSEVDPCTDTMAL